MLILCRKEGEGVRIGEHVELVLIKIEGQRARLGFQKTGEITDEEFRQIPIVRNELEQQELAGVG
jgi:carbon storage regulator CsrA